MNYSIIDYVYEHAADWGIDPVATGRQLKKLRRQHNLTQKELSELFDYCHDSSATREYISIVENGKQIPSIHFLNYLKKLYNCSFDELIVTYEDSREAEGRDQPALLRITHFTYQDECMQSHMFVFFYFVNLQFLGSFSQISIITMYSQNSRRNYQ